MKRQELCDVLDGILESHFNIVGEKDAPIFSRMAFTLKDVERRLLAAKDMDCGDIREGPVVRAVAASFPLNTPVPWNGMFTPARDMMFLFDEEPICMLVSRMSDRTMSMLYFYAGDGTWRPSPTLFIAERENAFSFQWLPCPVGEQQEILNAMKSSTFLWNLSHGILAGIAGGRLKAEPKDGGFAVSVKQEGISR